MSVKRVKPLTGLTGTSPYPGIQKKTAPQPGRAIVNAYTLIAAIYCISSAIVFYSIVQHLFLSVVHLLAAVTVIANYFILIQTKNFNRATSVILSTGTIVVVSLFATGGWANTGYLWPFAYLPFAFFLAGRTVILYWVVALFGCCLLVTLLHFTSVITIPYSPVAIANYFAALLVFSLCLFLFQKATVKREEFLSYTETLLEAAPDAVIVIDETGVIIKWNSMSEKLFGWTAGEVTGQHLSEIVIPHRYREAHREGMAHFSATGEGPVLGKTIEIQAINKNNIEFDIALSISPAIINERHLFIGFIRDITEKKMAERRLKESEEKYTTLFNSIDEGFCIIEMIFDEQQKPVDYRFLVINASFERQTGLHDAVGKRMREFAPDHEEHWFEIYGRIALTGESTRFENRAEQLHRWYEVYAFRFGDPSNLQVAILFNDITERKKTEQQLQEVNKELESFTYSVSHDLRAPLRIIDGYAEILITDFKETLGPEGNRLLNIVKTNARRMGQLIDDLLNLSQTGRKELVLHYTDMNQLVKKIIEEQIFLAANTPTIKMGNLAPAACDSSLLQQVWTNLISNAIKYSGKQEKPEIQISSMCKEDEVIYSIKDNGVGFDMKYAGKLFGVFQRLHKPTEFEGTGIGLALASRILTRHNRKIWVESEPGKGATFYFSLAAITKNELS